jgi:hypothetical protein
VDLEGVGDDAASDLGCDDVVAPPGVAGGLEDHGVVGGEVLGDPGGPGVQVDMARRAAHDHLLGVDGGGDGEMLVEIYADETRAI